MKLFDLLTEEESGPRIRYYGNVPNGYNGSPDDHKMIKKMKQVYKALIKGRGSVQLYHSNTHPPLDISYELPPLNTVTFLITYPSKREIRDGGEVEYMIDVTGKVKYNFHNFETQFRQGEVPDIKQFMMHRSYDVSFVYKKRFEGFDISVSA